MALRGFDSGEATQFPTYGNAPLGWSTAANQPSKWERYSNYSSIGRSGVQSSVRYSGTSAFLVRIDTLNGYRSAMRRTFASAPFSNTFLSLMFLTDSLTSSTILALTNDAEAISARIVMDASFNILVYAGTGAGTLKATIPTGWSSNQWHNIQLHIDTTTNTLEIKLDNGATINCSGTAMNPWYFLVIGNAYEDANVSNKYYDCIQVNDPSGSVNNSWPGSPLIQTALRPDADTATTDWTRSSGSNDFDMIKETAPDLDTTYVSSVTFGDASTYGFNDISLPANTVIQGVCLTIVAKRADAAKIIPVVSRGGTTIELTAVDVGVDYMAPIEVFIELDPITSAAWTQANLNATDFGFKHAAP